MCIVSAPGANKVNCDLGWHGKHNAMETLNTSETLTPSGTGSFWTESY